MDQLLRTWPNRGDINSALREAEARGREAGLTDAVAVAKTLPWRGESAPEFANRIVAEIRALRPTPGAAKASEMLSREEFAAGLIAHARLWFAKNPDGEAYHELEALARETLAGAFPRRTPDAAKGGSGHGE